MIQKNSGTLIYQYCFGCIRCLFLKMPYACGFWVNPSRSLNGTSTHPRGALPANRHRFTDGGPTGPTCAAQGGSGKLNGGTLGVPTTYWGGGSSKIQKIAFKPGLKTKLQPQKFGCSISGRGIQSRNSEGFMLVFRLIEAIQTRLSTVPLALGTTWEQEYRPVQSRGAPVSISTRGSKSLVMMRGSYGAVQVWPLWFCGGNPLRIRKRVAAEAKIPHLCPESYEIKIIYLYQFWKCVLCIWMLQSY